MAPTTPTTTFYPGDLPYARPALMRPPSPAGSINTEYGPDETDPKELAMSDEEFERKILAELKIDQPADPEVQADMMPIRFPFFQPGSHEERVVYQHTLYMLEKRVQELDENELVESIMMRGSSVQMDTPTSSNDVDEIMRSMMGSTISRAVSEVRKEDPRMSANDLGDDRADVFGQPVSWKGKEPAR
ncbi:unnamed protein product [Peniophora sp. CBMAI 1063]|nr:unnamed protein product [Peniophora sp. CBMAI 1063]